ncbi:unnamed protein product [Leuciscus chuanchicus]
MSTPAACKMYYETVRRSFRYKQPDLALQAEAVKSSARSRARRKRLVDSSTGVLQFIMITEERDLLKTYKNTFEEFSQIIKSLQDNYTDLMDEKDQLQNNFSSLSQKKLELETRVTSLRDELKKAYEKGYQWGSGWFFISNVSKSWSDSRQYCRDQGGDLIIINTEEKQRQLFHRDGHHPNKLGSRVLKDNIYFSLNHPSAVCANPLNQNGTHTPGHSMNDHRTSLQNGHDVDISHKDNDNTTEPQQPLLTDTISAEPCPQSSPQTDILELLQDSAPKDDFLENSQGSQDSISQPPITPEQQPLSPDTFSLSPPTPLLCFSQKMEELVHAGTRLSHSFAASPQISTKKRRAPLPPKPAGPAHPPPASVRALRPLPQRQGPHPPPSARGEPKTTDTSSQ